MSIHVTDPAGTEWTVSREWFGVPGWARRRRDWLPSDVPLSDVADVGGAGALAGIVVTVVVVVALLFLTWVLLPLVVLVVGLLVATLGLGSRLLSVSSWTVRAAGGGRVLLWRVRGLSRSRRAMREVAGTLARGEEPAIDGIAGADAGPA